MEGRAGARLQRLHLRASLGVDGSLSIVDGLLRLHLGGADPCRPLVRTVGVGRVGGQHPGVGPSGGPFRGDRVGGVGAGQVEVGGHDRPSSAQDDVTALEQRLLGGDVGPVLLDQRLLCLEQVDHGVELLLRQLVRVRDLQAWVLDAQVERGVGDLDRVVGHGDQAAVLLVVQHAPSGGGGRELVRVVQEGVGAPLQRHAVVDAVDRVERRRLELVAEVLPVGDQVDVHRFDAAVVDQPEVGVAGCGDHVPVATAAARHQAHHLVRGGGVFEVDLAAGRILERLLPERLHVATPVDEVERAFTGRGDRGQRLHAGGRRLLCGDPGRGRRATCGHRHHRCRRDRERCQPVRLVSLHCSSHVVSLSRT